ncbi:MAG: DUF1015 domain-containing protein [Actinomycetota bacterium]|nr:DUF1015 domain-containing protein [Actinomycetota bacterium]
MPEVRPFEGFRYANADELKDVVCPPYDVISSDEQEHLYRRHPHNAIRFELPRPESEDEPKRRRYEVAADRLRAWLDEGVLKKDDAPTFYVYRQDFVTPTGARRYVVGVIGALRLERFGETSGVLPHERTMPGPIEDRLTLLRACPVNFSPIYAIYRGGGDLVPFFDSLQHRPTAGRLADDLGNLHRLWTITAPAEIEMLAGATAEGPLVIADGHHRYETALAFASEQEGPGPHDAVMTFCVDADAGDLEVLPYNRAFRSALGADEIERQLRTSFEVKSFDAGGGRAALAESKSDHPLLFVFAERDLLVELSDADVRDVVGDRAPAWRDLDVVALHEVVFERVFGGPPEELVFSHDAAEVGRLVSQGWTGGVLLKPLRAAEVIEVAKSGERMPQKASYFWPKAITGFVFRSLK